MNKLIILILVALVIGMNYFSSINIKKGKSQDEKGVENTKTILSPAGDLIDKENSTDSNNSNEQIFDLWQSIKETKVLSYDKVTGFNAQIPENMQVKENQTVDLMGVGLMIESGISSNKVANFILIPFSNTVVCCESLTMEPMVPEYIVFVECSANSFEIPNNYCCIVKCTGELKIQKPNPHKLIYQLQNTKLEIISTKFSEIAGLLKSSNTNFCKLPKK